MRMGSGYDRLGVAVGERFGESLTDEILVERLVDGSGHLGEAGRRGVLGRNHVSIRNEALPEDLTICEISK